MHFTVKICVKQLYDALPDPGGSAGAGAVGRVFGGDCGLVERVQDNLLPEQIIFGDAPPSSAGFARPLDVSCAQHLVDF